MKRSAGRSGIGRALFNTATVPPSEGGRRGVSAERGAVAGSGLAKCLRRAAAAAAASAAASAPTAAAAPLLDIGIIANL